MHFQISPEFHLSTDLLRGTETQTRTWQEWSLAVTFTPHVHPFVPELLERLVDGSVAGLEAADTDVARNRDGSTVLLDDGQPRPALYRPLFADQYQPVAGVVTTPLPVAGLDFDPAGAYGVYNLELFFHIPVTIAMQLSSNGRYEEAQRWLHYVFDPTDDSDGPTPERFWKARPFQTSDLQSIDDMLTNLASDADPALHEQTTRALRAWQDAPFRPHAVARHRPVAYMLWTVMAYLDNLIAWGDALFRQDAGEAIGEAAQLYVLAANILGRRPQVVPTKGTVLPETYHSLRNRLDEMSNALVKLETTLPFDRLPLPGPTPNRDGDGPRRLAPLGQTLYFCVPPNQKLLGYWDTVADRLFKVRNSLNLQGVFRQLPAFDPEIDPALLARAAAAGVDVDAVVAGAYQPPPLVRFEVLAAKAAELCQQLTSLGTGLLSAIERLDAEALTLLRTRHETAMLQLATSVRYGQYQEAIKNRESLEHSLHAAEDRYRYYQRLLGTPEDQVRFQDTGPLDTQGLERGSFTAEEPVLEPGPVVVDIDPSSLTEGGGPAAGHKLSSHEASEMVLLALSQAAQEGAVAAETIGALLNLIPSFSVEGQPFGVGGSTSFGGSNLAALYSGLAAVERGIAGRLSYEASRSAKIGGYARREQDWQVQRNAAARDVTQINKQLRAAQIREFVAQREYQNHRKQIEQAEEVERFLAGESPGGKTLNMAKQALLLRETRGLYNQCYEMTFGVVRTVERALRQELGDDELSFVQAGYLSGPEGLLAGERLHLDLRRMELAHIDLNRREYELTQRVSLLQIAPWALVELRATGRCTFTIPEELFDLTTPGLYFRRLRSVAITIPCVTGELTGVACTARLLRSRIRTNPLLPDGVGYPQSPEDDDRFTDLLGATDAIVTSTGIDDTGTFDQTPAGGRLRPFELKGAVGTWSLELPVNPAPFDPSTITDVILRLQYTAREGGDALRREARAHLRSQIADAHAAGSTRLLSVRHEFPTPWARFTGATAGDGSPGNPRAELALTLRREHYPFFAGSGPDALDSLDIVAVPTTNTPASVEAADQELDTDTTRRLQLTSRQELGDLRRGTLPRDAPPDPAWDNLPPPVGDLHLFLDDNSMKDIYLLLTWRTAHNPKVAGSNPAPATK